jgi:hypothetical protein
VPLALNANECSGKHGKKQPPGQLCSDHVNNLRGARDDSSFVDN